LCFYIDRYEYFRDYKFNIQYSDNTEEYVEYGSSKRTSDGCYQLLNTLVREKRLQRIVNKLENEGYKVYPGQLALFMKRKIDKLIMQKK
jgi:hypothetical protein